MKKTNTNIKTGLSAADVRTRIARGETNITSHKQSKSYTRIALDNTFTLFNFINLVLAAFIVSTGSFKNLLFLGVMVSNIAIGSWQEIRAKRTLDKISLLVRAHVQVLRDGVIQTIVPEEVVLDDVISLKSGAQIVSDGYVVEGALDVDESLLSGESESVRKEVGDILYSGSFVVGARGLYQVTDVGDENYVAHMVANARTYRRYPSQLRDGLNKIIKYIGIVIIPLGILLFIKAHTIQNIGFEGSVLSTSAALIGMIPEGLVILTSIALAVGTLHLARQRVLIQELYCLETLARVDVLCLDKTGTLTEGVMVVDEIVSQEGCDVREIMGNVLAHLQDESATIEALKRAFNVESNYAMQRCINFTSARKYSGVVFAEGTFLMGAYECLVARPSEAHCRCIEAYARRGYRVISVVKSEGVSALGEVREGALMGHVLLKDRIRASAPATLAYFKAQGVCLKIISGDHPTTVSTIAQQAGVEGFDAYIDARTLTSKEDIENAVKKYHIFGRVSPTQKRDMIVALRAQGHSVAMSGDGVNDVLAFKEAHVSVAMASGSDMAKASANVVLLDNDFAALPHVLNEGRRVINNIQRVAILFFTKTIFSTSLLLLTLCVSFKYPFVPIHLSLVSALTIGIPSFFLALEANHARVRDGFLEQVIKVSLPAALSVVVCIVYIYISAVCNDYNNATISQLSLLVISMNGMIVLAKVSYPYTALRCAVLVSMLVSMLVCLTWGGDVFSFQSFHILDVAQHLLVFTVGLLGVSHLVSHLVGHYYRQKKAH